MNHETTEMLAMSGPVADIYGQYKKIIGERKVIEEIKSLVPVAMDARNLGGIIAPGQPPTMVLIFSFVLIVEKETVSNLQLT